MEELLASALLHLKEILALAILFTSVWIFKAIKKDLKNQIVKLFDSLNGDHKKKMNACIRGDANIYKELSRVLFTVKGSRIGLYQFHNGNVFSTNNPIWKISNTHEICENGVSTEIDKIQDMKASLFTQIISPVVNDKNGDGVTRVEPCDCQLKEQECNNKTGVYRIDPDNMENSYAHALLMNRNVKFALISSIVNTEDQVTGFVMLEFCNDGFMDVGELATNSKTLCDTTAMISQILDSLQKTS